MIVIPWLPFRFKCNTLIWGGVVPVGWLKSRWKAFSEHLIYMIAHSLRYLLLLYYIAVLWLIAQSCPTLCDPMDSSPPGSSVYEDSPDKHTGEGCCVLLDSSQPKDRTQVLHIAGRFFTFWATIMLYLF